MSPVLLATIDAILRSARVGGGLVIAAVVVLFLAQLLHWRRESVPSAVRVSAITVAGVLCLVVAVFITARFLIIR